MPGNVRASRAAKVRAFWRLVAQKLCWPRCGERVGVGGEGGELRLDASFLAGRQAVAAIDHVGLGVEHHGAVPSRWCGCPR